jgi:hypothetical protein
MPGGRAVTRGIRALVGVLLVAAAGLSLAVFWSVGLGWFLVLTACGGALIGAVLRLTRRRQRPQPVTVDAFARDAAATDTINVARVRVAGVGGLGMLLVALAVAFDFALVGAVLAAGLVGGFVAALAIILWRKRSGPLASSSSSPGARGALFQETADATPAPSPDADDRQPRRTTVTVSA